MKITEFGWAKELGLPYSDFEASFSVGNSQSYGRGTDLSQALAFEKAIAEAVERAVCAHFGISTVGVAVHTEEAEAREHSRREFLERYLFNRHRGEGAPLTEIFDLEKGFSTHPDLGSDRFFRTVGAGSSFAIVCVLNRQDQKFLGLSLTANDRKDDASHAYLEAARNSAAFSTDSAGFLEEVKINSDLWCCDNSLIEDLISKSVRHGGEQIQLPTITQTKLAHQEITGLEDCPSVVIRTQKGVQNA